MTITLTLSEARSTALAACAVRGASPAVAAAIVDAALSAERHGRAEMGLSHLLDYLDALRAGRLNGTAQPVIASPLPAFVTVDGQGGPAQLGFDLAFGRLESAARGLGMALLAQRNCYTAGELGYYVRRLAQSGLVALAWANSHAMMAAAPGQQAVYGTNPFAFAAPSGPHGAILAIDQATSATAFVNLLRAAEAGEEIPIGWAADPAGTPTSDPAAAMLGTLLPAGGRKGANLALLVEVMAAGLSNARWSLDAGHFREGAQVPETGLTVIAIAADALDPQFSDRLAAQLTRLSALGVHIPGHSQNAAAPDGQATIAVDGKVWDAIRAAADGLNE